MTVNDVRVLINPSGGDAQVLPEEYRLCDILVASSGLANLKHISSAYGLVTAALPAASSFVSELARTQKLPLATAGDGNIVIDFKNERNISIKRMV